MQRTIIITLLCFTASMVSGCTSFSRGAYHSIEKSKERQGEPKNENYSVTHDDAKKAVKDGVFNAILHSVTEDK